MIRVDATPAAVTAYCTSCHWRRLVADRSDGYTRGAAHQRSAHPTDAIATRRVERLATLHRHK